jgi:hypothetical protein
MYMAAESLAMIVLRRIPVLIVLASYLFANTLASSWHDHGDCCRVSGAEQHHEHDDGDHDHHHHGGYCQHHDDDDALTAPHSCAVCDFLALAPLPAAPVGLIPGGDVVSPIALCPLLRLSQRVAGTHLPRGPPA